MKRSTNYFENVMLNSDDLQFAEKSSHLHHLFLSIVSYNVYIKAMKEVHWISIEKKSLKAKHKYWDYCCYCTHTSTKYKKDHELTLVYTIYVLFQKKAGLKNLRCHHKRLVNAVYLKTSYLGLLL